MLKRFQDLLSAVTLMSLVISLVATTSGNVQTTNQPALAQSPENAPEKISRASFGKTPLIFEQNNGQTDREVKFLARANGFQLFLTETETVFRLKNSAALRMSFDGANPSATLGGESQLETVTNYYRGQDSSNWTTAIPNYSAVRQREIYRGIDVKYYGIENKQLEYDFLLAPYADAGQVKLSFDGAENISIDEAGNLVLKTADAKVVQHKPVAYQEIDGERRAVEAKYVVESQISNLKSQIGFELGDYDRSQPLTIDPVLSYLTYLGGSGTEIATDVKVDSAGNAFIAGSTESVNFPGPNAGSGNVEFAAFVSKISPDGTSIIYTTFLDGSETDGQNALNIGVIRPGIALDPAGNAYIAGGTDSDDFPVTSNAYQTSRGCSRVFGSCAFPEEGFVTKLNPQGTIVYSSYLGGRQSDYLNAIAVDSLGRAYVTGGTFSGATFPTKNQFQGTGFLGNKLDAFLTVFNSDGSDILYSTGLGGNESDQGNEIALDSANNVYIVGATDSPTGSFPLRNSFQTANGGGEDTFVAKFNTSLSGDSSLIYSSLIGGAGTDKGFGIAVDDVGQAYITGVTGSFNFPLRNAFRSTNQINEAFVTVLSSTGSSLVNSSFLGGSNQEEGQDIALGGGGLIYVCGNTLSPDFPIAEAFQTGIVGGRDAFIAKIKFPTGVITASFLGGNGFDSGDAMDVRGNRIFITGFTNSTNLSTTAGVFQPNPGATSGNADGFVARIIDTQTDSVGVFRPAATFLLTQSTTNVVSQTATFTSGLSGQKGVAGDWDGDQITTIGTFSNGTWKVRNVNFPLINPFVKTITFGAAGDLPVVGDWNGDGIDTPGVYRIINGQGQFTLTDSTDTSPGFSVRVARANFGLAGDLPIAGDWDGDGRDSLALFRPSTGETFFTNEDVSVKSILPVTQNPPIDFVAFLGLAGDLPVAGDWNHDGKDSLGLWRPSTTEFFLSDDNVNLRPTFLFGQSTDQPIAGDWDGKP